VGDWTCLVALILSPTNFLVLSYGRIYYFILGSIENCQQYEIIICHNPNLGLATKTKACKVTGQEGSSWVTSHALESVGKCEGMNLHTPKGTPILGVWVSVDFQIFKEKFQGSKHIVSNSFLYHWKALGT